VAAIEGGASVSLIEYESFDTVIPTELPPLVGDFLDGSAVDSGLVIRTGLADDFALADGAYQLFSQTLWSGIVPHSKRCLSTSDFFIVSVTERRIEMFAHPHPSGATDLGSDYECGHVERAEHRSSGEGLADATV
jgi:hypothetical protein